MFSALLDLIFPKQKSIRDLEEISPGALLEKVRRAPTPPEPWIESIFSYKDSVIRSLIWQLKFHRNKKVAKLFADILSDHITEMISDAELFSNRQIVLVPIPSSKKRSREKGFNQTFLVCDYLTHISIRKDILFRTKHSKPQSHTSSKLERLENIRDCFGVKNTDALKNKIIILFDDVTTTGATLREAHSALTKAGAHHVQAITIAH